MPVTYTSSPVFIYALLLYCALAVSPLQLSNAANLDVDADRNSKRVYDCSDPQVQQEGVTWNPTERRWAYPPNTNGSTAQSSSSSSCLGLEEPFRTRAELLQILEGKHIMFVGDSTVRNLCQVTFGLLCNPTYLEECGQTIHYPFQDEKTSSGMNCSREKVAAMSVNRLDVVERRMQELYGELIPNTCYSEIQAEEVELDGLTEANMYRSAKERLRLFWKKKRIPPMLNLKFRGFTASVIEAGCTHEGNAVEKVLKYLKRQRQFNSSKTRVPKFDILVTSASYHCSFNDFYSTPVEKRFYRTIPSILRQIRALPDAPRVLWTEVPHCTLNPPMTEEAKPKRAQCAIFDKFRKDVLNSLQPDGPGALSSAIPIAPSYWLTKGSVKVNDQTKRLPEKMELIPCVYADDSHAGLSCYRAIVTAFVKSVAMVLGIPSTTPSHAPAVSSPRAAATTTAVTEGAEQPLRTCDSQRCTPPPPSPGTVGRGTPPPPSVEAAVLKSSPQGRQQIQTEQLSPLGPADQRVNVRNQPKSDRLQSHAVVETSVEYVEIRRKIPLGKESERDRDSLFKRSFAETIPLLLLLFPLGVGLMLLVQWWSK